MKCHIIASSLCFALLWGGIGVCAEPAPNAGGEPTARIVLLPEEIPLLGSESRQRIVVQAQHGEQLSGDVTDQAEFSISDPSVVRVDEDYVVHPVGDGTATITAKVGDQQAEATVTVQGSGEPFTWSFRNHVQSVMTKAGCNSGACHGALAGKRNFRLTLRGYDPYWDYDVLTREVLGRRVIPSEPARSLMLLKPTATISHGGGKRFETGSLEYRVLAEWIAAGTPPPSEQDPRITQLEVLPTHVSLQPGDHQQFIVQAYFSDGHVEDVTRWTKFGTTDENIAVVDTDGRVTVEGHGEAAVTVWYLNLVDLARVTVPYPGSVDPELYEEAPRHNFIDDLVLQKLGELNLPPSPLCSDAEFIRRAYLDATGTLPPPGEVETFLADPSPDKRSRLVERLLQRPEFVDYWAYKWSDLFLVSTRRLPSGAMWSFYNWIRESVASNKSWDELTREILTAQGDNLVNGAANYFVLHKDPTELTETTSVTFMGLSITCARCHNHPLEKWTQDDYYGMANLFSRVKQKDGDAPGEMIVFLSNRGNINHPRKGEPMPPRPLEGEPMPLDSQADRRAYFADWLTSPDNEHFSRSLVNRVWANFMGRGLVEAVDDLRETNPATNEELFAALSDHFVENGYDVQHLIRTVMNSATYQLSSAPVEGNAHDDRYYSHYLVRRLPAEVLLDCLSQVTDVPTEFESPSIRRGPSARGYPKGWRALQLPDSRTRSYFLDTFGRPQREITCECERTEEPSLAQALHLTNGPTLNDKLRAEGGTVDRVLQQGLSDEEMMEQLYLSAYSRYPTVAERQKVLSALAEARSQFPDDPEEARNAHRQVVEDLFWAVLTSREFLFNH